MRRFLRVLVYVWAAPVTLFGLLLVLLSFGRDMHWRWRNGVLEVSSPRLRQLLSAKWLGGGQFLAMTVGHVVLGRDQHTLARCRVHERMHVAQVERWGVTFPLCYLLAGVFAKLRGGQFYWDNVFEVEARRAEASQQ